jgi:predicted SAM-dependent methyltransferase
MKFNQNLSCLFLMLSLFLNVYLIFFKNDTIIFETISAPTYNDNKRNLFRIKSIRPFSQDLFQMNTSQCPSISRSDFFEQVVDLTTKTLLELGPFNNPAFTGRNVKYFDVLDRKGLIEKAKKFRISSAGIPSKIDYVSNDADLTTIRIEEFDYVFSSHVIEHQLDLITHFNHVYDLLKENGKYLLIIPDKRYCFDHFIGETRMSDVLNAHYLNLKRHPMATSLSKCEATHNDAPRHWAGDNGVGLFDENDRVVIDLGTQYRDLECYQVKLNEYIDDGGFVDYHRWRFMPNNFAHIFNGLYRMGLIKLKLEKVWCTQPGTFEFMAIFGI